MKYLVTHNMQEGTPQRQLSILEMGLEYREQQTIDANTSINLARKPQVPALSRRDSAIETWHKFRKEERVIP